MPHGSQDKLLQKSGGFNIFRFLLVGQICITKHQAHNHAATQLASCLDEQTIFIGNENLPMHWQSWALSVFFIFPIIKNDFLHFLSS